jgi:hypothetical protein
MAKKKNLEEAPSKTNTKGICFVIMPFGGWLDEYYRLVFCPAIKSAGLEPYRSDDLFRSSSIVNDIWSYTKSATLLLADLSQKNANVFYELGLAHALAKPVILVGESMDDIPFDLRGLRIIIYEKNDPNWGKILKDKIKAAILETLQSPAEAVLPTFLDVKQPATKTKVSPIEKDIIELKQEISFVQRKLRDSQAYDSGALQRARPPFDETRGTKLIARYVQLGLPAPSIAKRLENRGYDPAWISRQIALVRSILADASTADSGVDGSPRENRKGVTRKKGPTKK